MATTTNYEEIQDMEISALRAIFMDNFQEKQSKSVWNVRGRHCLISLSEDQSILFRAS